MTSVKKQISDEYYTKPYVSGLRVMMNEGSERGLPAIFEGAGKFQATAERRFSKGDLVCLPPGKLLHASELSAEQWKRATKAGEVWRSGVSPENRAAPLSSKHADYDWWNVLLPSEVQVASPKGVDGGALREVSAADIWAAWVQDRQNVDVDHVDDVMAFVKKRHEKHCETQDHQVTTEEYPLDAFVYEYVLLKGIPSSGNRVLPVTVYIATRNIEKGEENLKLEVTKLRPFAPFLPGVVQTHPRGLREYLLIDYPTEYRDLSLSSTASSGAANALFVQRLVEFCETELTGACSWDTLKLVLGDLSSKVSHDEQGPPEGVRVPDRTFGQIISDGFFDIPQDVSAPKADGNSTQLMAVLFFLAVFKHVTGTHLPNEKFRFDRSNSIPRKLASQYLREAFRSKYPEDTEQVTENRLREWLVGAFALVCTYVHYELEESAAHGKARGWHRLSRISTDDSVNLRESVRIEARVCRKQYNLLKEFWALLPPPTNGEANAN